MKQQGDAMILVKAAVSAWVPGVTLNSVRKLVERFPMPIAVLGQRGEVELLNERFTLAYDASILESAILQDIVQQPERAWQRVVVQARDRQATDVQAQAMRIGRLVLLFIDAALDSGGSHELELLRERIAELEKLSATDHLTGAWNRAHLDRVIAPEMDRSVRHRQPLSLLLFDIDYFKRINDTHGHLAGDAVLCELVRVISANIRATDMLFRWGGEEFVVLTASTGYRKAEDLAQALRVAVANHGFPIVGNTVRTSIGVAEVFGDEGKDAWFRRLDEALYAAKGGGRDCVVVDRCGSSDLWAEAASVSALHLTWLEGYECGDPTIDREHRELFELANILIDASFARGSAPAQFDVALDDLLAHIERHFVDEEALLEQRGYEKLSGHRKAHAHLLKRGYDLKAAVQAGQFNLGNVVNLLANDIVARHIFAADRDFFPLFRKGEHVTSTSILIRGDSRSEGAVTEGAVSAE
jgi:diguanylate cyclase (GGDEF)-like protein/hemerythrin-like metal-binding protein